MTNLNTQGLGLGPGLGQLAISARIGVTVREVESVTPVYDPPMEGGVMTLNCNGWSTPVRRGGKMLKRKTLILNMAKTHKVGI